MKKILLVAIACVIGATACSGTREPSDAQLGILLRSERADAADTKAAIDNLAVECLRAWSGDKDLLKNLPMRSAGETGRKSCRDKLEGWLADASRNPDKFAFADLSAPDTVRRAVALMAARDATNPSKTAATTPTASDRIPNAFSRPSPATVPAYAAPASSVDLGVASLPMGQAESLCEQASRAVAAGNGNPTIVSYARFCAKQLPRMRVNMEQFAKAGNTKAMESLAQSAENMANTARDALAQLPAQ